jgi:transcriptional regulator with XRE-family HTH domain
MRLEHYLKCVGENIRKARRKAGLRQVDVNLKCGLTYRHYQNIEAGKINVTLATLRKIALTLEASIAELVEGC